MGTAERFEFGGEGGGTKHPEGKVDGQAISAISTQLQFSDIDSNPKVYFLVSK
jgi:hypothetical protein